LRFILCIVFKVQCRLRRSAVRLVYPNRLQDESQQVFSTFSRFFAFFWDSRTSFPKAHPLVPLLVSTFCVFPQRIVRFWDVHQINSKAPLRRLEERSSCSRLILCFAGSSAGYPARRPEESTPQWSRYRS